MYRFKSFFLCFFILLFTIFVSNISYAKETIVNRSYTYVQLGAGIDVLSKLFISLRSYDEQKKIWETSNYNLTGYGDINPYVSMGFYLNSARLALEAEYGVHTVFEKTLNGKDVKRGDNEKAYATMNYFFINARKDLFTLFGEHNIIYGKFGIGASMVNNITLNKSSAMNVPTPAIQLGFGYIREINNYLDIDLEYRYKVNFSKRVQVSNGIKQIYRLQAHTFITSIRLKV